MAKGKSKKTHKTVEKPEEIVAQKQQAVDTAPSENTEKEEPTKTDHLAKQP